MPAVARASSRKVWAVQAVNKYRHNHEKEKVSNVDHLRCTFEDAESNQLLEGIRMSTRDKIELFEEMLDFAWKTGAIRKLEEATASQGRLPATTRTPSKR